MNFTDYLESGKLRCICADWDNTLFGWMDVLHTENENRDMDMTFDFLTGSNWYKDHMDWCAPVAFMQKFLREIKPKMHQMFCLSIENNSIKYSGKTTQVLTHYNGLFNNVFFTDSPEGKLDIMNRLCMTFNYSKDEVLLIDDHPHINNIARTAGYAAISPMGIYAYMSANGESVTRPIYQTIPDVTTYAQMELNLDEPNFERDIGLN